jgi:signal peptidase I
VEPSITTKPRSVPVWKWIWIPFLIGAIFWSGFFFFQPTKVFGSSLLPTFKDADLIWLRWTTTYRRGDIVRFKADQRFAGAQYIKRIVAIPGDRVRMVKGQIFINGKALDESYIMSYWKQQNNFDDCSYLANSDFWTFRDTQNGSPCGDGQQNPSGPDLRLEADEYFVLGENRSPGGSEDSRSLGPIKHAQINRVVVAVGFPPRALERPEVFRQLEQ